MGIGLALGGGAVRGLAHIGVFKVLTKHQIPISFIAGTSMGGAIGGLIASGIAIEEIEEFVLSLPSVRVLELGIGKLSMLGGDKVYQMLLDFLDQKGLHNFQIEDTVIPFQAITVDLIRGEQYVFDHGSLSLALRATTAVPGVFAPVLYNDMVLVDGGVLNNVPADIVKASGAEVGVAVDVGRELIDSEPTSMFDVMRRSIDVMMLDNVRQVIKHADVVLRPDVGQYQAYDLSKIRTCIDAGEQEAEAKLSSILKRL